jgi:hypothetical protein
VGWAVRYLVISTAALAIRERDLDLETPDRICP